MVSNVDETETVTKWDELVTALEDDYGPSEFDKPELALFKLTQDDSVQSYYQQFTILANRVDGITQRVLLSCFISGLKRDIQRDIIPLKPTSIPKAAALARLYEDKYFPNTKSIVKRLTYPPDIKVVHVPGKLQYGNQKNVTPIAAITGPSNMASSSNNSQPFRRISFEEMQIRKAKGLRFNCDEKFTPSHRCASRKLLLLQWDIDPPDDIVEVDENTADYIMAVENSQPVEEEAPAKLALNAMNSSNLSSTLRFTGTIKGHPIKILLDGGSDENFIQPRLAKFLHLEIQPTSPIKVMVGNDTAL